MFLKKGLMSPLWQKGFHQEIIHSNTIVLLIIFNCYYYCGLRTYSQR